MATEKTILNEMDNGPVVINGSAKSAKLVPSNGHVVNSETTTNLKATKEKNNGTESVVQTTVKPVDDTTMVAPKKEAKKERASKKEVVAKEENNAAIKEKTMPVKAAKKSTAKNKKATTVCEHLIFQLKYHTEVGQNLFITGNHELLGNNDLDKAVALQYQNNEYWQVIINADNKEFVDATVVYNYFVRNADGTLSFDWGNDKQFNPSSFNTKNVLFLDAWNYAGYYENAFYTVPFQNVLLKANHTVVKISEPKKYTHQFKIKAPLLEKGQTVCLLGNNDNLHNWNTEKPVLMSRAEGEDFFAVKLDLPATAFPITYKYGVYDVNTNSFVRYETGTNRVLYDEVNNDKQTIVNDGFVHLPSTTWKGAGVAIPVFSLKSESSFGVGEFSDLKLLVDWANRTGLKLIQILPINDTTATYTNADSYPYAAISAFALHPMYLNVSKVVNDKNKKLLQALESKRQELNNLDAVDYANVVNTKIDFVKQIYPSQKEETFASKDYQQYFEQNKHWLVPYAVFCYLRDEYETADFNAWPAYRKYHASDIAELTNEQSKAYHDIALNYFIQYHLHLQLKDATDYAHSKGVVVKGDIAIGIYRYGADAWENPELYHMDVQAGAPPDDFAVKGQNWGFPTYNWEKMQADGFAWWKQRFEQMSYYFDAFRIDHILGFFRIWSIPLHAVEGILGYFVPAIAVHRNEFNEKHIWFDKDRYTKPFINDSVLWEVFGADNEYVKSTFLNYDGFGNYTLKPAFSTQREVEQYFAAWETTDHNNKLKQGLYDLISNVVLFEVEGSNGEQFHFRFAANSTSSFKSLDVHTQAQLQDLYVNYFFRRQDIFWKAEAMQKLPALKRVTNMLVCGEDLGMVPDCVNDVMNQLGLLSLEIQRMPKDPTKEFFHPADAPYLSVVTPSTHDMSTIRGWWEEDRARTQKFYNNELGQWGNAPYFCEGWVNKAMVVQHLYSPAMWSIFQLQDLMGISDRLRRENPNDERINQPADPKHFWKYRMHLSLELLLQEDDFNNELKGYIQQSSR